MFLCLWNLWLMPLILQNQIIESIWQNIKIPSTLCFFLNQIQVSVCRASRFMLSGIFYYSSSISTAILWVSVSYKSCSISTAILWVSVSYKSSSISTAILWVCISYLCLCCLLSAASVYVWCSTKFSNLLHSFRCKP